MDEGLLSSIPAWCGQLVNIIITLEPYGKYGSFLHTYLFKYCPATDIQKDDEGLPSIILAGRGLLVAMLITLEPIGIFQSNFAY